MTPESVWRRVQRGDGCWLWTGAKNGYGYGYVKVVGRKVGAHRVVWELARGPIADGLFVLHRCDNPGCVNPGHLFLGTHQDNMDDREAKGRNKLMAGERHGQAKLTAAKVQVMRGMRTEGTSWSALGREFGVTRQHAKRVCIGQYWR